jgi:hypothetical protein
MVLPPVTGPIEAPRLHCRKVSKGTYYYYRGKRDLLWSKRGLPAACGDAFEALVGSV